MYEDRNGIDIYYYYDSYGTPTAIRYYEPDGTSYRFILGTNSLGDVNAIYNMSGDLVVKYEYDAWGNIISETNATGGTPTSLAQYWSEINPFRYRGYYYDAETGLYYLQSRYYDAEVGRFVSADNIISEIGEDVLGNNLYTYCFNNPSNRFDDSGNWSMPNWAKVVVGTVALAGAIALTVATGGGAAAVAVGVAKIVGSVAVSTAVSAGVGYLQNGKQGAIDGACNGFMFGSLSACGGAALKYTKVRAATTGTSNSMGKAGEKLARIDPSKKQSINVNGRTRIPDKLTENSLVEVKNVKYISNTQQLRDFATYATTGGRSLKLQLYVRPNTKVAQTVIDAGWDIKYLW